MSEGLPCPDCGSTATTVVDSRPVEGSRIRRRRLCANPQCQTRFTTFESAEADWVNQVANAIVRKMGSLLVPDDG